jgi:serine/threonine protein kinase
LFVGQTIDGRFKVLSKLGSGGFATVYLAQQIPFDRLVALKLLKPEIADADAMSRFLREAKILCSLSQRNLPAFYGYGKWNDMAYIATEYLKGQSLYQYLDRRAGALELSVAINLIRQLLDALQCAHANGIIHRDITPGNVMLIESCVSDDDLNAVMNKDNSGQQDLLVKLIDFGVAKYSHPIAGQQLTEAGTTVGTALYMSPEQSKGQKLDERGDIYSVGCLFFFCLTGQNPFSGEHPAAIMRQHVRDPLPRLTAYDTKIGAELVSGVQAILDKATAKNAKQRYATAQEFDQDLAALAEGRFRCSGDLFAFQGTTDNFSTRAQTKKQNRLALLVCAVGALILFGIGTVGFFVHPKPRFLPKAEPSVAATEAGHRLEVLIRNGPPEKALPIAQEMVEKYPCGISYRLRGRCYFSLSDKRAIADLEEAALLAPGDVELELFDTYMTFRLFEKALKLCNAQLEIHPGASPWLHKRAMAEIALGRVSDAIQDGKQALLLVSARSDRNVNILLINTMLAGLYARSDAPEDAMLSLRKAERLIDQSPTIGMQLKTSSYRSFAEISLNLKDYRAALKYAQRAQALFPLPNDDAAWVARNANCQTLALALLSNGKYKEAHDVECKSMNELLKQPDSATARSLIGSSALHYASLSLTLGRSNEARDVLEVAIGRLKGGASEAGQCRDLMLTLRDCYRVQCQIAREVLLTGALVKFDQANGIADKETMDDYMAWAEAERLALNWQSTLAILNEAQSFAIKKSSKRDKELLIYCLSESGLMYQRLNDTRKARTLFEQAMELIGNDFGSDVALNCRLSYATLLYRHHDDKQAASLLLTLLEHCRQQTDLRTRNQWLQRIASTYRDCGSFDEAIALYKEVSPRYADESLYNEWASAEFSRGEPSLAQSILKKGSSSQSPLTPGLHSVNVCLQAELESEMHNFLQAHKLANSIKSLAEDQAAGSKTIANRLALTQAWIFLREGKRSDGLHSIGNETWNSSDSDYNLRLWLNDGNVIAYLLAADSFDQARPLIERRLKSFTNKNALFYDQATNLLAALSSIDLNKGQYKQAEHLALQACTEIESRSYRQGSYAGSETNYAWALLIAAESELRLKNMSEAYERFDKAMRILARYPVLRGWRCKEYCDSYIESLKAHIPGSAERLHQAQALYSKIRFSRGLHGDQ